MPCLGAPLVRWHASSNLGGINALQPSICAPSPASQRTSRSLSYDYFTQCRALTWGGTIRPTPPTHPASTTPHTRSASAQTKSPKASSPCASSYPSPYGATIAHLLPSLVRACASTPRRRRLATTTGPRYGAFA